MATFIITFDVDDPARLLALKKRMQAYNGYCPIHKNCWAIVSKQTPAEIRDDLSRALSLDDRVFIIRSGVQAAWRNPYSNKNSEWLKERL